MAQSESLFALPILGGDVLTSSQQQAIDQFYRWQGEATGQAAVVFNGVHNPSGELLLLVAGQIPDLRLLNHNKSLLDSLNAQSVFSIAPWGSSAEYRNVRATTVIEPDQRRERRKIVFETEVSSGATQHRRNIDYSALGRRQLTVPDGMIQQLQSLRQAFPDLAGGNELDTLFENFRKLSDFEALSLSIASFLQMREKLGSLVHTSLQAYRFGHNFSNRFRQQELDHKSCMLTTKGDKLQMPLSSIKERLNHLPHEERDGYTTIDTTYYLNAIGNANLAAAYEQYEAMVKASATTQFAQDSYRRLVARRPEISRYFVRVLETKNPAPECQLTQLFEVGVMYWNRTPYEPFY